MIVFRDSSTPLSAAGEAETKVEPLMSFYKTNKLISGSWNEPVLRQGKT